MKRIQKFKRSFQFSFEFSFSVSRYWIESMFQRFADYFIYLEIIRFRLWNSAQSNSSLGPIIMSEKINTRYSAKNILVLRPVYTKIIDWFESFPPIRGFAWDLGVGVQSSEAELVRYEHSIGLDNYYVYGRFERYIKINYPKRYIRYFFLTQKYEDYKNINYFSKFIKYIKSSTYATYSISFVFFFVFFLLLDTIYLFIYWALLSFFIKINSLIYFGSFKFNVALRISNDYVFLIKNIINPIFRVILFFGCPIFYFFYISFVFFYLIWYFLNNLCLIIYLRTSKYFFSLFFVFFKFFYLYVISRKFFTYGLQRCIFIFWKIIYYTALVFVKSLKIWLRFSEYLRSNHWFINAIRLNIGIFVELVIRIVIVLIIFKIFWRDIFWFSNYVIIEAIGMEYFGLVGPGAVSILVISSLAFIVPEFYSLMKFTENARRSVYELGYDDEAEISDLTVHFFRALSRRRGTPKIMRTWPLANEILPLQMMNEAETSGKFHKNFEKVVHYLKPDALIHKSRSNFIAERLASLDPGFRFNSVVDHGAVLESEARVEDQTFFEEARSENSQKFRPKEFNFIQSDLLRFYQIFSDFDLNLTTRVICAYQSFYYDSNLRGNFFGFRKAPKSEFWFTKSKYPSSFIFSPVISQLIFLRSSEFSKMFKSSVFFLRSSAEFPVQRSFSIFEKLDWIDGEYLTKLGEVRSSWNWENNLVSTTRSWVRIPSINNLQQYRGLSNSRNLFQFGSVLEDSAFQKFIYSSVKYLHRHSYLGFSIYMQILYDIYWAMHLNTNFFITYTFNIDFSFSSALSLPNWLFYNSLFNVPASYPTFQDEFGSIISHLLNLEPNKANMRISNSFSRLVTNLSKLDYLDNELEILACFQSNLEFYNSYTDSLNPGTFSIDFYEWKKNLGVETRIRDRQRIDNVIENYIVDQTGIVELKIFTLMYLTDRNYQAHSAFTTYLHERTSITLSRYVLREKEKVGGLTADIMGIIKALTSGSIEEDKLLREFQQDSEFMESIDQYDEETHRQLLDARVAVISFPAITPSIIVHLYLMFVNASFAHFFMAEEVSYRIAEYTEQSEIWALLVDFGLWLAGV